MNGTFVNKLAFLFRNGKCDSHYSDQIKSLACATRQKKNLIPESSRWRLTSLSEISRKGHWKRDICIKLSHECATKLQQFCAPFVCCMKPNASMRKFGALSATKIEICAKLPPPSQTPPSRDFSDLRKLHSSLNCFHSRSEIYIHQEIYSSGASNGRYCISRLKPCKKSPQKEEEEEEEEEGEITGNRMLTDLCNLSI